jgi:hypothetical protein
VIDPLTAQRDALLEALETARKEAAQAQEARKRAEERIPALQREIDGQHTRFVFMLSRLEKMGLKIDSLDENPDDRIKRLESQYEQILAENRRLLEVLNGSAPPAPEDTSTPGASLGLAPQDGDVPVEIEASPPHLKRPRA